MEEMIVYKLQDQRFLVCGSRRVQVAAVKGLFVSLVVFVFLEWAAVSGPISMALALFFHPVSLIYTLKSQLVVWVGSACAIGVDCSPW